MYKCHSIVAINYADHKYKIAQRFNSKQAKKYGADRVIEYSEGKLSDEFKEKNKDILKLERGNGYWIWKPYIINDALMKVEEGDYVVYTDSGSAFIKDIHYLIDAMEKERTCIMSFQTMHLERFYTKRDAFLIMDCDIPEVTDTPQICGGYIVLRKCEEACLFINEFLRLVQNMQLVTDSDNKLGKKDHDGFVEHRHDQSIFSLLCKKWGIAPFRDPSQYGNDRRMFSQEINSRSDYPQIIDSHRNSKAFSIFQLRYKWWLKYFDIFFYGRSLRDILRNGSLALKKAKLIGR